MFGGFFSGDGDDIVEEVIEVAMVENMLSCGRCYGTCNCGHARQGMRPLLGCGRCYGTCGCSGYDALGNLLAAEIAMEIVEDIFDGGGDFF